MKAAVQKKSKQPCPTAGGHHKQHELAHSYVPRQRYAAAFDPCEALMKGTLFPELYGVYPIPQ